MANLSLPTDSAERKNYPMMGGLFGYFGAALAGVAHHSWKSNEKHNPGQPLHWSIDKSTDHADCIARHLLDLHEMLAAVERGEKYDLGRKSVTMGDVLDEAHALAWRALALCQTLHMHPFVGAPLPFNARKSLPPAETEEEQLSRIADQVEARAMLKVAGWPAPRCVFCMCQPCKCLPIG